MATGNDDAPLYQELETFLMSERVDVRKAATDAVIQIRHEEVHREKMLSHAGLMQALIRNTSYEYENSSGVDEAVNTQQQALAQQIPVNALQALVYLSSHGTTANQCVELLLESHVIGRLLEIVLSSSSNKNRKLWRSKVNFAMALIANLTRLEQGAVQLVGQTLPDEAVTSDELEKMNAPKVKPTMELLLDRYMNPDFVQEWPEPKDEDEAPQELTVAQVDSQPYDPYQHFAAILMNITQVEQGRRFLLRLHYTTTQEDGTSHFQSLLPQIKSANPIRRQGTAGTMRNICLDQDSTYWLLHQVEITRFLLYPLAGPEELEVEEKTGLHPDLWLEGPDKKREIDQTTRLYLVEAILLLCSANRKAREKLRLDRVYIILKWADMVEESEQVSECINECVQYLRRDEEGTAEGSSDAFVANAYKRIMDSGTASKQVRGDGEEGSDDYDGVD